MEDHTSLPLEDWSEKHVSSWLKSIKIKDHYIQKLHDDEVTGAALMEISEDFLNRQTKMKPGQIQLLLRKRDELLKSTQAHEAKTSKQPVIQKKNRTDSPAENKHEPTAEKWNWQVNVAKEPDPAKGENTEQINTVRESSNKRECRPRPFDTEGMDFKYVKHTVLQPENGNTNLITPCHEYKSLGTAARLDKTRLQTKFAYEVYRFACGCMNVRANGTIHFGVMDNTQDTGYVHGEIVGIPVKEKDVYVDALNRIDKCVTDSSEKEQFESCVRSPKFIEVIDKQDSGSQLYIVEVDIEPAVSIVKGNVYKVSLPKFNEKTNKIEFEKRKAYRRVRANTEPISDEEMIGFYQRMEARDKRREEAESTVHQNSLETCEDLGRKLCVLLTDGKKYIDDSKQYIIVTNKCAPENLKHINFLLHMKIFCVFDFDPDSKSLGFCGQYREHHAVNMHFLKSYANESRLSSSDYAKHLHLYDQTSWIFCNGCNDYLGGESSCDEHTWIRTKKKHLKKAVSMICNEILDKGSFVVLFVLFSPVEQPLIDTFHEFYAEMNGHEDIVCISESKENYNEWANHAQRSCRRETLDQISIVGMKMSHIDVTVQTIQPSSAQYTKQLPVFNNMLCSLKPAEDERLSSLEVLSVNLCDNTNLETIQQEQASIERYFYKGGKVKWINFWLAEKQLGETVIERDAYLEVDQILDGILKCKKPVKSVEKITIYHQAGSGGSTIARQLLWNFRKELRCAVVKPLYPVTNVCQHAIQLREYEEKDRNNCLPVLLLVEDCDGEYIDDLSHELRNAIASMTISTPLCFILLNCKRSSDPQKKCKALPLRTVAVTHKLSEREKKLFSKKREKLLQPEEQLHPEFILTFVLMSYGFERKYIQDFVKHLLEGIDHASREASLIRYVALLNCYIQNSYISVSHCEAFLGFDVNPKPHKSFERSLTEEARLLFIHLRESTVHILSVRIIHPSVAEEILQQLSVSQPQSSIANSLLQEKVLFNHRFGRDDYIKFIRDLFMKRCKSEGDNSSFSPLIEHVRTVEKNPDKAIDLLKTAYTYFEKDAFFAQQLARLHYTHKMFDEAKDWAEVAKFRMPHNSFILDTEGRVYWKWFVFKDEALDKQNLMPESATELIGTALKAIECFQASEKAAKSNPDCMNNSGYFGEVDVGCRLLKLLSSVDVFSNNKKKLLKYLLTDHIPEEVKKPWHRFHNCLKGLQKSIYEALEWISEDLTYFQTDKNEEEEEKTSKEIEHINNPRRWLLKRSSVYASYFSDASFNQKISNKDSLAPLIRSMNIYQQGGGSVSAILSNLSDHKTQRAGSKLEDILSMYPEDPLREKLDHIDLVNYIFTQIALGCVLPDSPKLVTLQKLQELSLRFYKERNNKYPPSAFMISLLFWPGNSQDTGCNQEQNNILTSAIAALKRLYNDKIKDVSSRKKRIFTHFFLGHGKDLDRFIHKTKLEKYLKGTLNEKRLKWLSGEVWKTPEVTQLLKRVKGWTENGSVFVQGTCKDSKIKVFTSCYVSMPNTNENVTFYLGFSFDGPIAFNVQVIN
ncbi:sterile alpha motif domain-containing protein 9-like [Acipenser ruthenus]|uniref:sterile alpha motif domain-containing protein 9-like n=1 Tax=Acipenser ruthenus TaxID=7906 RepID=UPI00145A3E23|nr:sterile alpha motif domain-containing protein 9-like [Acipenser ruthenus]XP_058873385.1 sterile alpha motif domain-containing protein 9-like [Acipenser ruthenus]